MREKFGISSANDVSELLKKQKIIYQQLSFKKKKKK